MTTRLCGLLLRYSRVDQLLLAHEAQADPLTVYRGKFYDSSAVIRNPNHKHFEPLWQGKVREHLIAVKHLSSLCSRFRLSSGICLGLVLGQEQRVIQAISL